MLTDEKIRHTYLRPNSTGQDVVSGRAAVSDDVEHDELCGRMSVDFAVQNNSRSFTFHAQHDRTLAVLNHLELTALLTFNANTPTSQQRVRQLIIT